VEKKLYGKRQVRRMEMPRRKRKELPKEFKHSPIIETGLQKNVPDNIPKHNELSKKLKLDAVTQFSKSKAITILSMFWNMEMPEWLLPYNYYKIMKEDDEDAKAIMENKVRRSLMENYKFAMNWITKVVPKEVGIFGAVKHDHTLAALSKRAMESNKPKNVIGMVQDRRDGEFKAAGSIEDEVNAEMDEYYE